MIDIRQEKLVTLPDAAKLIPGKRGAKHVHIASLYRWMTRGAHGIMLESVWVGGSRYTSVEAVERFVRRVTRKRSPEQDHRSPAEVDRAAEAAERRLQAAGA